MKNKLCAYDNEHMIFFTKSAEHLSKNFSLDKGSYIYKHFCDGELYIKLDETPLVSFDFIQDERSIKSPISDPDKSLNKLRINSVNPVILSECNESKYERKSENVTIITSTQAPAENILELLFLLDAVQRNIVTARPEQGRRIRANSEIKINILFTYFGYARQEKAQAFEALSAEVISKCLSQFKINKILIVHPHSLLLQNYLNFESIIPYELYLSIVSQEDIVVAPDLGAKSLNEYIAKQANKEFAWLEKTRPEQERVQMLKLHGDVKNKKVIIIDDMISTGNTMVKANQLLLNNGAKSVKIIATHGVFCPGSLDLLDNSPIEKIYVTNSLNQNDKKVKKIEVIDISGFLESKIKLL